MSTFFDFAVNLDTKTAVIKRSFAAPQQLVWDSFTKAELLDQWWAPQPFESRTRELNFVVEGRRFYAMVGPDGMERWSVQRYLAIDPITSFRFLNTFSDAAGNPELPGSDWTFTFTETDGITTVTITIYNESRERMERVLAMGFKEGMQMTLGQLDGMIAKLVGGK